MSYAPGTNTGHGHVWIRPDGQRTRCGGPRLCDACAKDLADKIYSGFDAPIHRNPLREAAAALIGAYRTILELHNTPGSEGYYINTLDEVVNDLKRALDETMIDVTPDTTGPSSS